MEPRKIRRWFAVARASGLLLGGAPMPQPTRSFPDRKAAHHTGDNHPGGWLPTVRLLGT